MYTQNTNNNVKHSNISTYYRRTAQDVYANQ